MASPEPKHARGAGANVETARILPWPRPPARRGVQEREFLPAALEIIETPASPLGRLIAFTILAFFCAALAWSWLGKVDIIASAQGRLAPTGKTKMVQPLEAGIVREILVTDGDHVHAGDPLIRLDAAITSADRDRVAHDLMTAKLDVARLLAVSRETEPDKVLGAFVAPEGAPQHGLATARAFALSQAAEQASKLAGLDRQMDQKRAEAEGDQVAIEKLQSTMPLLEEKESLRTQLLKLEYGNRFAFLDAEQALLEARHDLTALQRKAVEIEAARAVLERQRDQARAEYDHKVLSDLSDAEQKASEQSQDLIKTERKLAETELRAPIDGIVQQLAIHTIGGVVTPAEPLLIIVPEDQKLIVEAMVLNDDVGFVHVGQEAEVKVQTFNFTRYGLMHGRVIDVSPDTVTEEKSGASSHNDSGPDKKDESGDKQPAASYVARIVLDGASMMIDGRQEPLRPGMAVTAEIKTGSRRILDYLLSPLRRYAQDAIRER
jgi:hemolysin D